MIITSLDNDNVKKWKKLCKKKYRDEFGIYLVEGEHLVEEAYKSGVLEKVIVLDGESYSYDNIIYVSYEVMKAIRLPKDTKEQIEYRNKAIQDATLFSINIPFKTAKECLKALNIIGYILEYGNQNATEYGVNGTYYFTGYAEGYGPDAHSKNTLASKVEYLETVELGEKAAQSFRGKKLRIHQGVAYRVYVLW